MCPLLQFVSYVLIPLFFASVPTDCEFIQALLSGLLVGAVRRNLHPFGLKRTIPEGKVGFIKNMDG